jgi:ABC-type Fe3+-hydroxamate transport system substrate-binding protein
MSVDEHAPVKDKKRRRWWVAPLVVLVALFVGVAIGNAGHSSSTSASPASTLTATATVDQTVTAPAAPAVTVSVQGPIINVPGPRVTVRVHPVKVVTVVAAPKPPAVAMAGDGTFLVGTDVKPGTYRSATPASGNCYWERMSNLTGSGETEGILANNNSAGPSVVTILSSDVAFNTSGCSPWTLVQ